MAAMSMSPNGCGDEPSDDDRLEEEECREQRLRHRRKQAFFRKMERFLTLEAKVNRTRWDHVYRWQNWEAP